MKPSFRPSIHCMMEFIGCVIKNDPSYIFYLSPTANQQEVVGDRLIAVCHTLARRARHEEEVEFEIIVNGDFTPPVGRVFGSRFGFTMKDRERIWLKMIAQEFIDFLKENNGIITGSPDSVIRAIMLTDGTVKMILNPEPPHTPPDTPWVKATVVKGPFGPISKNPSK